MENDIMIEIWQKVLYPTLASTATTTFIAIIAAAGAFLIYFMRRRDQKKDAANIILLEIKNAERNLEEARKVFEEGKIQDPIKIAFPEKLRLMPTESWTKYKYLFVRDLAPEQWDEISKFYENCKNFDDSVELKESSFKFNAAEIRKNIQRIVADYSTAYANNVTLSPTDETEINDNQKLLDEAKQRKNVAVDTILHQLMEAYGPDKPYNDAAYYFKLLPWSIINTPTGDRLKRLANRKILFRSKNGKT